MTPDDALDDVILGLCRAAFHVEHGLQVRAALYVLATIFYKRRMARKAKRLGVIRGVSGLAP